MLSPLDKTKKKIKYERIQNLKLMTFRNKNKTPKKQMRGFDVACTQQDVISRLIYNPFSKNQPDKGTRCKNSETSLCPKEAVCIIPCNQSVCRLK
jgi:hypothetical protein